VKPWFDLFSQEQILLMKSEEFFADTTAAMSKVHEFLGVPDVEMVKMARHKSFPYPKMEQSMRQRLVEYFEPYNQALYNYLGRDFCWG
jgi:hypothetical protein